MMIIIMRDDNDNGTKIEEDIKTFIELQELVKERKIKVNKDIDIEELANKVNGDYLL